MKFDELEALIKLITYKPNWILKFDYRPDLGSSLQLICQINNVQDAYGSGKSMQLTSQAILTGEHAYHITKEQFLRWVRQSLIDMEIHELDEWLKVDGRQVFPTH